MFRAALFIITKKWGEKNPQMSMNWRMEKQNAVSPYNGVLLFRNKKEWLIDSCYHVGKPWKHMLSGRRQPRDHRIWYDLGLSCGSVVKNLPARRGSDPWIGKIPWKRAWQPTPVFLPGESPWIEEPGGLPSMVLQRVGYDWVTKHSAAWNKQNQKQNRLVVAKGGVLWDRAGVGVWV